MNGSRLLWFGVAFCFFYHSAARANSDELKDHLLVVFNRNFEDSEALARYYAAQRGIPNDHVLGLSCPNTEEISRADYTETIHDPINRYLLSKQWIVRQKNYVAIQGKQYDIQTGVRNDIWAIVLMRGVPLKITAVPQLNEPAPANPALAPNNAAVDSELATLPILGLPISGVQINPYYDSPYARNFDELDARNMILVTRLDAPAAADVRRMIDNSIYAEELRLTGRAYLDARGLTDPKSGYIEGDQWLQSDDEQLRKRGWSVELDHAPEIYPDNLPWSDVALYLGWYTEEASGPFIKHAGVFAPGAIAYHIHSFSASTLRDPNKGWVGPLLSHGATATMGAVYEPYLDLTPHLDVFMDRLLQGYSFAEAAYASERVLSWMITVIGDPLYRPFRLPLDTAIQQATQMHAPQREWLLLEKTRTALENGQSPPTRAEIDTLVADPQATRITWEGYGDLLERPDPGSDPAAAAAYHQAFLLSHQPVDRIRNGMKAAAAFADAGLWKESYAVYEDLFQSLPTEAIAYDVPHALARTAAKRNAPALPADLARELPK